MVVQIKNKEKFVNYYINTDDTITLPLYLFPAGSELFTKTFPKDSDKITCEIKVQTENFIPKDYHLAYFQILSEKSAPFHFEEHYKNFYGKMAGLYKDFDNFGLKKDKWKKLKKQKEKKEISTKLCE